MTNLPLANSETRTYAIPRSASRIDFRWRALLVFALVVTMSWLSRHFELDDALIYARYIQNALDGRGLVFNVGEPINALTSVLDTWLMLGIATLLHGHILLIEAVLSSGFLLAATLLAEQTVPLAGIFLAANAYFYLCKGMETTLFLLMLMLCARAYAAGRINWLPLLCTLAVLTRFEGGALVAVVAWTLWRNRRMPALASFLLPAAVIALYFLFNLHFYHALLPQSAAAKLAQGRSGFWGRWPLAFLTVGETAVLPLGGSVVYFAVLGILAWYASKDARMSRWNEVVLPFLVILASFYILFNISNYHWYYAPFTYFLTLYTVRLLPEERSVFVSAVIALLAVTFSSGQYLHQRDKSISPYVDLAEWMSHNTSPNAHVASVETGTIGWYSHRYLIDIVGLTTPRNAIYTEHADFDSWFSARPDYIVVHPFTPFPWEKIALASPDYEFVPYHAGTVYLLQKKKSAGGSGSSLPGIPIQQDPLIR